MSAGIPAYRSEGTTADKLSTEKAAPELAGLMEDMTWPEVARAAELEMPVVLAVGATEQHGPHLPLSTDCHLPVGVALEAAKRIPLLVAPPIRFGAPSRPLSGGGESFPGTLSIRGSTLGTIVTDILSALARSGFRRLCVLNWHFENGGYLWEACDVATQRHRDVRVLLLESGLPEFTPAQLAELYPKGFPGWRVEHAAIMETSMMLALRPNLVRKNAIVDDQAERCPPWDVLPTPPEFIPSTGVLWHATEASEALGERFLVAAADHLELALRQEFGL
jgi:creatinine amidohydrolase